jgi:peptidoglycan/xylan/chitin deacetylase (PgdA/CDA1 family)
MTSLIHNNYSAYEILCYHRVVKKDTTFLQYPDDGLSINVDKFEKHLRLFKKNFSIVDLKRNVNDSRNCKKNILITFDDGYKDIITIVLPLIEKYNIPIVIFITTAPIHNKYEFCWWIDLWKNLVSNTNLKLTIKEQIEFFELKTFNQKMKCYKYLSQILINMKRVNQLLFFNNNGLKFDHIKDFLSKEDLQLLSSHPLITLGFHSNFHLNYGIESKETIEEDIEKMFSFFINNSLLPNKRLLAFCYGIYSSSFVENKYFSNFDCLFTLGYRALSVGNSLPITSRINIDSKDSSGKLILKIYSFRLVKRIMKYFY